MKRRQLIVGSVAIGANFALPAARAVTGKRPELLGALPEHRLQGTARLTVYGFKVYDSRLWVAPGFSGDNFANQAFGLELDYLRDFKNDAIVERSLTEMQRFGSLTAEQVSAWRVAMLRVIPNVKKGDRIVGINVPGEGATFWVNGQRAGDVADAEFARLFFSIWLSPKTSQPKMRSSLLATAA